MLSPFEGRPGWGGRPRPAAGSVPSAEAEAGGLRAVQGDRPTWTQRTFTWRGGRGSSLLARPAVWPAELPATDPTSRPLSDSRNSPRLPGRIETSEVAALREEASSSFVLPACGEKVAAHLRPCPGRRSLSPETGDYHTARGRNRCHAPVRRTTRGCVLDWPHGHDRDHLRRNVPANGV